jgi:hypothetical protein
MAIAIVAFQVFGESLQCFSLPQLSHCIIISDRSLANYPILNAFKDFSFLLLLMSLSKEINNSRVRQPRLKVYNRQKTVLDPKILTKSFVEAISEHRFWMRQQKTKYQHNQLVFNS